MRSYLPTGRLFTSHILIPVLVMTVYLSLASFLLPSGVNRVFAIRSVSYSVPLAVSLAAAYVVAVGLKKAGRLRPSAWRTTFLRNDLLLLLLPLAPIVQYILNNREILTYADAAAIFLFFLLLASALTFLVPLLLTPTGPTRPLAYLGVAFIFSIANMATLSAQFSWHEWGSLRIQIPVFAGVWILTWMLYEFHLHRALHMMLVVYFVSNSILQLIPRQPAAPPLPTREIRSTLVSLVGSRLPHHSPSVYLLVYDAYVGSDILSAHGIDNRGQEQYLTSMGFKLYPRTYSVGATSLTTMNRVLNVALDRRDGRRDAVSGGGTVIRLLSQLGYRTFGVFPSYYFFRGVEPTYDHSYPTHGSSAALLIRAILEGAFRFDIDLNVARSEYLGEKYSSLTSSPPVPKFVYSHSNLPRHSQFSGACRADEASLFADRLEKANLEMRHDIDTILNSDPSAVIIVAGDHGPYLTKNCAATSDKDAYDLSQITRQDIQERFGTFLAIRWPSRDFEKFDDITILQDLFPAVLAYMFEDPSILQSRLEPITYDRYITSGAYVANGIIVGGVNDGQPLFPEATSR